jgi:hypothetical protein
MLNPLRSEDEAFRRVFLVIVAIVVVVQSVL